MNTKITHIVFHEFSKNILIEREGLHDCQIISLNDDLRIGPLLNVDNQAEKLDDRKMYLSNILGTTSFKDEIIIDVERDVKKLNKLSNDTNTKTFYIWSGTDANDIISTARLISILMKSKVTIFITDFTRITIKNLKGNSFSPRCMRQVSSCQIDVIFKSFKRLETAQLIEWNMLWLKLKSENSQLRILDTNSEIIHKEETHFDDLLVSYCDNEFQPPAMVIAKTLVTIDFNISDWFLNWRLKQLSKMKRIETTGELKDMKDYKVKIVL